MKRSFLKQVAPLLVSLVIVGGLTLMLRKYEEEAPRPFDRLIVEVLPEIPDLQGRPEALLERLELAHGQLEDRATQREALVELAYLYHANGFVSQAESCYLGLESFETDSARWPYLLGVLKEDRRDQAAVAKHFARSLKLDPTSSLAYLRLGHAYREGGLLDEARTVYEYRLLGAPGDGWAQAYLGLLSVMEEDLPSARSFLEAARAAIPNLSLVHDVLPDVYRELGDFEAARAIRVEGAGLALIQEPWDPAMAFLGEHCYDADRLFGLAKEARLRGEFERALGLLQRSVEFDVENALAVEELKTLVAEMEGQAEF
ncbi:tetratricopeptide repeat protein [Pelagicoccus mobilis]|uniref:Tetratricopeptide repeat protein n=1 Tax=Pelagicoccus mobilis TaxID=415221 RepID=A0A934RV42_9BACT|nr:hypothetical protein [Pelagicoccus mobilis]MBK1877382.1 hypothetical protein [Pelagicoccus mobilis]